MLYYKFITSFINLDSNIELKLHSNRPLNITENDLDTSLKSSYHKRKKGRKFEY